MIKKEDHLNIKFFLKIKNLKTYKLINDGKLAEYDSKIADNKNFWSSHWGTKGVKDSIAKSKKGYMGGLDFL